MEPSIAEIQALVCEEFGILRSDMLTSRRRSFAKPRQVAMWLAVRLTSKSFPVIGRCFDRDHSTVMYAVDAMDKRIFECDAWGRTAIALRRRLCADERQMDMGSV